MSIYVIDWNTRSVLKSLSMKIYSNRIYLRKSRFIIEFKLFVIYFWASFDLIIAYIDCIKISLASFEFNGCKTSGVAIGEKWSGAYPNQILFLASDIFHKNHIIVLNFGGGDKLKWRPGRQKAWLRHWVKKKKLWMTSLIIVASHSMCSDP